MVKPTTTGINATTLEALHVSCCLLSVLLAVILKYSKAVVRRNSLLVLGTDHRQGQEVPKLDPAYLGSISGPLDSSNSPTNFVMTLSIIPVIVEFFFSGSTILTCLS